MSTQIKLTPEAIRLFCDLLEEKETELSIKGSPESLNALNQLWELYQSFFVD